MNITEKLGLWGATHARARSLEQAARQPGSTDAEIQREATRVRQHADQLHREIYDEMGRKSERPL